MLVGTYEHRLDTKGRLVLPARFREELGSRVIGAIGLDRCVVVYPLDQWKILLAKFQALPASKGKTRDLLRFVLSSANELEIDGMGRILLPQSLRADGALKQDVSIIGVGDHLEMWDTATWRSHREQIFNILPQIAEEVGDL